MATYTENYNLLVTEPEDVFDIDDFNENFETIDAVMANNESAAASIDAKIGNSDDTNLNTIFGKLNDGTAIVKCIQHVIYDPEAGTTSAEVPIDPVDANKCFVIFERLFDKIDCGATLFEYTLKDSSISVTHPAYEKGWRLFGFWVIEFN